MNTKKINEKINKIIFTTAIVVVYAVAFFMVAYLVYNAIDANYSPVKTETAIMKTVEKSISSKVFIVRDETYISGEANGTVETPYGRLSAQWTRCDGFMKASVVLPEGITMKIRFKGKEILFAEKGEHCIYIPCK